MTDVRVVPASIGQRLLWFLEYYRAGSASLNCPVVCRLHGPLDVGELELSLTRLAARHEALRTTLERRGRDLVQVVHPAEAVELHRRTLRPAPGQDPEAALQQAVADEVRSVVDVAQWPVRFTLWEVGPGEHVLAVNMHHLVSDAWSCGIIVQDLLKILEAVETGMPALAPIGWQYPQFAQWQHEEQRSGGLQRHQQYWTEHLAGVNLPRLPSRPAGAPEDRRGELVSRAIDAETFLQLRAVARTERTTIFAVMLSLYYLTLQTRTGGSDLAVASLFANRSRREVQSTVGFFANMLVLRTQFPEAASFREVLKATRQTVVDAFLHESIPYQMLPLRFQQNDVRADDVVFQMLLTPPPGTSVTARGIEFDLYVPDALRSRFGFELGLIPEPNGECRAMLFFGERFDPAWAQSFLDDYVDLAGHLSSTPDRRLNRILS